MSSTDHDAAEVLDPHEARTILDSTQGATARRIEVRADLLFLAWGLAWSVGYLSLWWSTRGQEPYTGPAAWAGATLGAAMLLAAAVTAVHIIRASAGLSGRSSRAGLLYGLTWPVAFVTWQSLMGAVVGLGLSDEAAGLLYAAGPGLLVAVIYCLSSVVWEESALFVVGAWLAVTTAVAVWTGPATATLVLGAVGGTGFLVGVALARRGRA